MKLAVISDVHANLEALLALRRLLKEESPDEVLFLGDAVGYGPEPNECLDLLREMCPIMLLGNHDAAAAGLIDTTCFNVFARRAVEITEELLTASNREYLASLPYVRQRPDIFLVHATPCEPQNWHYIFNLNDAAMNFDHFEEKFCFIGHSHAPMILSRNGRGRLGFEERMVGTGEGDKRFIVNVGSVGQPRDGDPRASLAVYDEKAETLEIVRVPYDISRVQEKMEKKGLPVYLINRLAMGQ